jgi:hypothetical protein
MEERRPNTHEKGNEIASARDCKSVTCFSERIDVIKMDPTNLKEKNYSAQLHSKEEAREYRPEVVPRNRSMQAC